jgi:hypothetical protein
MGRYYSGDIEGKFWFAVQRSNAADRFGVIGNEPNYIEYYFEKEDLPKVKKELAKIKKTIGSKNLKALEDFFKKTNGYNDEIMRENGVLEIWNEHNRDYADYILGEKIKNYLKDNDSCEFTAEL